MTGKEQKEKSEGIKVSSEEMRLAILQLSVMLGAGISLDRALESLANAEQPNLRALGDRVHCLVSSGQPLSVSLAKATPSFGRLGQSMVYAGERSGRLVAVLSKLSVQLEKAQQIRKKLISALTYPAGILLVGGVMMFFMATYMLPQFLSAAGPALSNPPWPTMVLISISENADYLLLGILIVACSVPWLLSEVPAAVNIRNWMIYRSPVLGSIARTAEQARVFDELSILLNVGITIDSALSAVHPGDPELAQALKDIRHGIRQGRSVGQCFGDSQQFDSLSVAIIHVAEETGKLSKSFEHRAEYLEETADRLLDDTFKLFEPLAMLILGFAVGFVVLGCFLPIYEMISQNI